MEGRVRYDATRNQGNANLVAQGIVPPQVTVLSDRQLSDIERLIDGGRTVAHHSVQHAQALKQASHERAAKWPDNFHNKQERYLKEITARAEAEERRRQAIDEEEASLRDSQRKLKLADAQRQLMDRDQRGRQLKSALLEHYVIQERERQIAMKLDKKELEHADVEEEVKKIHRGAVAEVDEKRAAAEKQREKCKAVKEAQLSQLHEAMSARREFNAFASTERKEIERLAALEEEENKKEKMANREWQHKFTEGLQQQAAERNIPKNSPRARLERSMLEPTEHENIEAEEFLQKKKRQQQLIEERVAERRHKHQELVQRNADKYFQDVVSKPSPRDRTVDKFAEAPGIVDKLTERSLHIQSVMKANRTEVSESNKLISPRSQTHTHFSPDNSPSFRRRQDEQIQMLTKFEKETKTQQAEEVLRIKRIQQLQAAEKKCNQLLDREAEREEAQQRREAMSEEDELFRNFIDSQIPENVTSRLRQKATATPRSHKV